MFYVFNNEDIKNSILYLLDYVCEESRNSVVVDMNFKLKAIFQFQICFCSFIAECIDMARLPESPHPSSTALHLSHLSLRELSKRTLPIRHTQ